jgi:hypothetical protein
VASAKVDRPAATRAIVTSTNMRRTSHENLPEHRFGRAGRGQVCVERGDAMYPANSLSFWLCDAATARSARPRISS